MYGKFHTIQFQSRFFLTLPGKRKSPIMLLSWSPVLGRGTSKSILQPVKEQIESQRLNMLLQHDFI